MAARGLVVAPGAAGRVPRRVGPTSSGVAAARSTTAAASAPRAGLRTKAEPRREATYRPNVAGVVVLPPFVAVAAKTRPGTLPVVPGRINAPAAIGPVQAQVATGSPRAAVGAARAGA